VSLLGTQAHLSCSGHLLPDLPHAAKDLLPDRHPSSLAARQGFLGRLESPGHDFLEPCSQGLQNQHCFPLRHGKSDSIPVEDDDACVESELGVAAEQRNGKVVGEGGLVGIVESVLAWLVWEGSIRDG
jgi:hypothetical protein